jgi:serine protease Do/serine protease DegQ
VTLADSDKLRVGDVVFAVGNPLGVGQTVTMGIVSAKNRSLRILEDVGGYEDFIQTDAAINMGNSGGALVDARGRLVGINSAIISPSRGNIGIGLAVPINLASWIMSSLIETGTVARGYLGISTEPITPDVIAQLGLPRNATGVIVSDVIAGKAAEKAGLKLSDAILAINGHPITSREELRLIVARIVPGESVKLKIVRGGKEQTVDVNLDRFDDKPDELFAGVNVRPLTPQDRRQLRIEPRITGLLVTGVAANSPYRNQLPPGAVIVEINRNAPTDLAKARSLVESGQNVLAVYFDGTVRYLAITVP